MTEINYLDKIWNPISGCSGKNCKARCWVPPLLKRFPKIHEGDFKKVQFHPDRLERPLHWRKPQRVGVCFTGDIADQNAYRDWFLQIIMVIRKCPQHQFFILTKQPERLAGLTDWSKPAEALVDMTLQIKELPSNIYWGISICDQEDADRMIPELLKIPGKHWVSYGPGIGPVDFEIDLTASIRMNLLKGGGGYGQIDWLVIECESGPDRRPMPLEWVESAVDQAQAAGVPVFVKQLDIGGKVVHDIEKFPKELQIREWPE